MILSGADTLILCSCQHKIRRELSLLIILLRPRIAHLEKIQVQAFPRAEGDTSPGRIAGKLHLLRTGQKGIAQKKEVGILEKARIPPVRLHRKGNPLRCKVKIPLRQNRVQHGISGLHKGIPAKKCIPDAVDRSHLGFIGLCLSKIRKKVHEVMDGFSEGPHGIRVRFVLSLRTLVQLLLDQKLLLIGELPLHLHLGIEGKKAEGQAVDCVDGAATKGVYSFIKHFAFNDQEDHRGDREGQYSLATFLNEQAAREIYLVPFEMCIKSGSTKISYVKDNGDGTFENATAEVPSCLGMMTSFKRIGYTWAGGSYNLITGIVRGEWGFNGFIVTDNANTGVFMDAGQMIQAGADGKLTNLPASARYDFDVNNETDYHFGRIAAHHILYTIVNSNAMDGGMTGSRYVPLVEPWQKLIYAIDVIGCALIALMVILTIRRFVKKPAKKN